MDYTITIRTNDNDQATVFEDDLVKAVLRNFDYAIIVEEISGTIEDGYISIEENDAYLDDKDGSIHDAVVNGLNELIETQIKRNASE